MKLPSYNPKIPINRRFAPKLVLLSLLVLAILVSCSSPNSTPASKTEESNDEKRLEIIAAIFPHYDFVRAIVGDRADVTMLLPPGTESHSYDPTPADIITINECDLFIYTGADMEAWAESILEGISNKDMHVLALAEDIQNHMDIEIDTHTHDNDAHEHEHESEHDHEHAHDIHIHEHDPLIWTSPVIASVMIDSILSAVCELDPANEHYYIQNANAYKEELKKLDTEFRNIVATSKRKEIYYGDRFALKYFVEEYGIEVHAAFDSCSSETEPSVATLTKMIDEIKQKSIPVIYHAELNDPKIARSLSEATGVEILLFHSCHNVSKEEFEDGITYVDIMWQNAQNLRKGLN